MSDELERAAESNKHRILTALLEGGRVDPNYGREYSPLTLAVRGGHEECVRILPFPNREGVDPSSDGCAALIAACSHGRSDTTQIMKLLLPRIAWRRPVDGRASRDRE